MRAVPKKLFAVWCLGAALMMLSCERRESFVEARPALRIQEAFWKLITEPQAPLPTKVVFIVDNSPSMDTYQEQLRKAVPTIFDSLGEQFRGEVYRLTTTELPSDLLFLPGFALGSARFNQAANLLPVLRFHFFQGAETSGKLGQIRNVRNVKTKIAGVEKAYAVADAERGVDLKKMDPKAEVSLEISDAYQLQASKIADFSGAMNATERAVTLQQITQAILVGGEGSSQEQSYCQLLHALLGKDQNHILNEGDRVAMIFLNNGDAVHIPGESCLQELVSTLTPAKNTHLRAAQYETWYMGSYRQRSDEFDTNWREGFPQQRLLLDCGGTSPNPLCNPLDENTTLGAIIPCTAAQRADYAQWFVDKNKEAIRKGLIEFNPDTFECKALNDFYPWVANVIPNAPMVGCSDPIQVDGIDYPNAMAYFNSAPQYKDFLFYTAGSPQFAFPNVMQFFEARKAMNNQYSPNADSCWIHEAAAYTWEKSEKRYLPGLSETSTKNDLAKLILKLAENRFGRSNFSFSSIANDPEIDPSCGTPEMASTSILDLVKSSPTPTQRVSICASSYAPALDSVRKFIEAAPLFVFDTGHIDPRSKVKYVEVVATDGSRRILDEGFYNLAPAIQRIFILQGSGVKVGEMVHVEFEPIDPVEPIP